MGVSWWSGVRAQGGPSQALLLPAFSRYAMISRHVQASWTQLAGERHSRVTHMHSAGHYIRTAKSYAKGRDVMQDTCIQLFSKNWCSDVHVATAVMAEHERRATAICQSWEIWHACRRCIPGIATMHLTPGCHLHDKHVSFLGSAG